MIKKADAIKAARAEALEEAAQIAESWDAHVVRRDEFGMVNVKATSEHTAQNIAGAIRKLIASAAIGLLVFAHPARATSWDYSTRCRELLRALNAPEPTDDLEMGEELILTDFAENNPHATGNPVDVIMKTAIYCKSHPDVTIDAVIRKLFGGRGRP